MHPGIKMDAFCICIGFENNFDRLDEVFYVSTQGIPYDLGSVMHYNAYGFAVDRRIPTIRPIDSTVPLSALGQRSGFSNRDIAHVHNQYCGGGKHSLISHFYHLITVI